MMGDRLQSADRLDFCVRRVFAEERGGWGRGGPGGGGGGGAEGRRPQSACQVPARSRRLVLANTSRRQRAIVRRRLAVDLRRSTATSDVITSRSTLLRGTLSGPDRAPRDHFWMERRGKDDVCVSDESHGWPLRRSRCALLGSDRQSTDGRRTRQGRDGTFGSRTYRCARRVGKAKASRAAARILTQTLSPRSATVQIQGPARAAKRDPLRSLCG